MCEPDAQTYELCINQQVCCRGTSLYDLKLVPGPSRDEELAISPENSAFFVPEWAPGYISHDNADIVATLFDSAQETRLHHVLALKVLRETFGKSNFRPSQFEAINAVWQRRDCLVIMPTSWGTIMSFACRLP